MAITRTALQVLLHTDCIILAITSLLSYLRFIEVIEEKLGKKAIKNFMPIQPGDVPATYADVDDLINAVGFKPNTPIEEGISKFVEWYKDYYKIS